MNDYLPKPFTPDDLYQKISGELKIELQKNGTPLSTPAEKKATYDLAYLRSVSDNNEDFLQEMLQTFVQTIPPVLNGMTESLREQDWKKLSRLAHQIKPSFGLMGMDTLRKTVFYIEETAEKRDDLATLTQVTQGFVEDCQLVIEDLRKEIGV